MQNEDRYARPRHDGAYWAAKTEGMDFSAEDRIDTPRFNRILWAGLMGDDVAFPQNPKPANLRRHRGSLLRRYAGLKQTGAGTAKRSWRWGREIEAGRCKRRKQPSSARTP